MLQRPKRTEVYQPKKNQGQGVFGGNRDRVSPASPSTTGFTLPAAPWRGSEIETPTAPSVACGTDAARTADRWFLRGQGPFSWAQTRIELMTNGISR
jgi:hypothetical protein